MAVRVWNDTADPSATMAGTLTCVACMADTPTRFVAVSAAHVIAPLTEPGALGPQPGDQVRFAIAGGQTATGTLWFWQDLQRTVDGFSNLVDAALVDVSAQTAATLFAALGQPALRGQPVPGAAVQFSGATSGVVAGTIGQDASDPLIYPVLGGGAATVAFKETLTAALPAAAGDSGSLLVSGNEGVGMLVTTDGQSSRFLPLDDLFSSFNLQWVDTNALNNPAPAALIAVPATCVPNPPAASNTLARTLWGEARSEPLKGIQAIASVVLNRAMHPRVHWWGTTVVGVCRAPNQFSCWNGNDPNLPKLLAVTTTDRQFRICMQVAQAAINVGLTDNCHGATHYHTKSCMPSWAVGRTPCADIGNHLFYNDIE